MFYSQSLLSKKGPLGNIWIASYCFKKLKKEQIAETDIISSVDKIIPQIQISYRILAQLLLGVVKIYSKKVDYLYHDCNEALIVIAKALSPLKKSLTGASHNKPKKTNTQMQRNAKTDMESQENVNHNEGNACSSRNETITKQVEAIFARYQEVTITLPNCFELDAFDLDSANGIETAEHHNDPILEDEWTKEKDQHTILSEHHNMEDDIHSKDNYGCFSPMNDVTQSSTLDFEINALCNSNNIVERHEVGNDDYHGGQQEQTSSDLHIETQFDHFDDDVGPATPIHGSVPHESAQGESDICVDSGIQSPKPSVITPRKQLQSPNFAVTTPARRDRRARPTYRKRKRNVNILFDDTIVLSNGTMRTWIHDASDLVCKRRKAPHTSLDVWKTYKFTNLPELFNESVLPYLSPEHKAILLSGMSVQPSQAVSTNLSSSVNLQSMTCDKDIDGRDSLASESAPVDNYIEIYTPEKTETRTKEASFHEIPSFTLETMDMELCSAEREASKQANGWSVRTRAAAKYLYDRFLACKEQRRNGNLILNQILEGQTRAKAARFFYETLTLKGIGCIDVEQEVPYGDIVISANAQLEAHVKQ